ADLWSAGVIFYELLTGREAFAAPSELAKLTMILTEEVLAVDHAKPHLLPWRPFFAQALARDVHRRFGSAAEMDRAMADADHAARAAGIGAPLARTTDMSPELPRGVPQKSAPPQIQVLPTPVPPADPVSRPIFDSTLKAGDVPVIEQPGARVPVWLLFLVALACLAIGIAVGVFVGRG
ncbi:MAG TPA: hypothetical protein VJT73_21350, partial [Polyangiaceae bacterium]|nr:hypothetical protein [Polyangiaceae bacterium]